MYIIVNISTHFFLTGHPINSQLGLRPKEKKNVQGIPNQRTKWRELTKISCFKVLHNLQCILLLFSLFALEAEIYQI